MVLFSQKRYFTFGAAAVLAFLFGVGVGKVWFEPQSRHETAVKVQFEKIHRLDNPYRFTKPLVAVRLDIEPASLARNQTIQALLEDSVSQKMKSGSLETISVYFTELETGLRAGVNENVRLTPASMLKVPLMLAFLKKAETDPEILKQHILFGDIDDKETKKYLEGQKTILQQGKRYPIETLILEMIIESDNVAANLLLAIIKNNLLGMDRSFWDEVFIHAGVTLAGLGEDFTISTKSYSLFFRGLYNATILDGKMSEMALSLLSRATFHKGLTAKLPEDVTVAHKFGVHDVAPTIYERQLHDCGIVYPIGHNPYFLCVMTKGKDRSILENTIAEISRQVFDAVQKEPPRAAKNGL